MFQSTSEMFNDMMRYADLIAAAIIKRTSPAEDRLTQRQAYDMYGRTFIVSNTVPRGPLRPIRRGKAKNSPIEYSKMEIMALIEAEKRQREQMEVVFKENRVTKK